MRSTGQHGNGTFARNDDPDPPDEQMPNAPYAADRLRDVLVRLFGRPVPVRIRAWDGTESGPTDGPHLTVRSRRALRRVLWRPDELGLGRAFVAGEVTVEDSLVDMLERLAELGGVAQRSAPTRPARPGGADRRELLRTAVLLGAVGPQPKPPPEETGGPIDPVPARLAEVVLGETLAAGAADLTTLTSRSAAPAAPASSGSAAPAAPAASGSSGASGSASSDSPARGEMSGPAGTDGEAPGSGFDGPRVSAFDADRAPRSEAEADLDGAQREALRSAWDSLGIASGARILDLRAGWGGFLRAAGKRGAVGRGYVRDPEQAELANAALAEAGLGSQLGVRVGHWREAADGAPYDAVVALGYSPGAPTGVEEFAAIRDLVRPGGRLLYEVLTRRAADQPPEGGGLVGAYLGPDAALPTLGEAIGAMDAADLEVLEVSSIRQAAAATVRTWVARLEAAGDDAASLAGIGRVRLWRLLLAGLATGLWSGKIGAHRVLARCSNDSRPEANQRLPEQRAEAS